MPAREKRTGPRTPPPMVDLDTARCMFLPPSARSPVLAREFTRETLEQWRVPMAYEVVLIVNELVTNAVLHTDSAVMLTLDLQDAIVRIVVGDDSAALPTERDRDLDATGGRGLVLVAAMSHEWGVNERNGGKTVWADVIVQC